MKPLDPQKSLEAMHATGPVLAQARADRVYAEEYRKSLKAILMKEHAALPAVAQEREAYADPRHRACSHRRAEMTPDQRTAALRLADDMDTPISVWADHVAHLLRELASEPVQEPVCWGWRVPDGRITMIFSERKDNPDLEVVPLFTHPPQQRKPLTEEQMKEVMSAAGVRVFQPGLWDVLVEAGRSIERHYGIGEAP